MAHAVQSQQEVFAFLGGCRSAAGPVRRIDTHAAAVFLAGERAFKVKKAVRFPFLDFSTLERRKQACLAEIEVNRAYAHDIYIGVAAITRQADGRLAIDGDGEVVEWAVKMRRFDENRTLDRLADTVGISAELADALARAVAAAHEKAPPADAETWIAALWSYLDQNKAEFQEDPDLFSPEAVDELDRASRATLGRLASLLERRGRGGHVRRGHGDLHLGNIALIEGRPVPFDAIEFDPVIASGDTLYDLAFLLMDLIERRLPLAANIVLNRYLWETRRIEDLDALTALPFFISVRAAIRAKVTAARREGADAAARAGIEETARAYFRLARASLSPSAPKLIAIGGLSGTGKSALARALAPDFPPSPGAVVLRSDIERKALFGAAETELLPRDAYTPEANAKVYTALQDKAARVAAAGHSVIVDAVFARASERRDIAELAATSGLPFAGLFLAAPLATRIARVEKRVNDASDANASVARGQEAYDLGELEWSVIDAAGAPEETLARARAALRANA